MISGSAPSSRREPRHRPARGKGRPDARTSGARGAARRVCSVRASRFPGSHRATPPTCTRRTSRDSPSPDRLSARPRPPSPWSRWAGRSPEPAGRHGRETTAKRARTKLLKAITRRLRHPILPKPRGRRRPLEGARRAGLFLTPARDTIAANRSSAGPRCRLDQRRQPIGWSRCQSTASADLSIAKATRWALRSRREAGKGAWPTAGPADTPVST